MGLMPAYFTTSSLRKPKPKPKSKSQSQIKATAEHIKFLRSVGITKKTLQKKKLPLRYGATISTVAHIPSLIDMGGTTFKSEAKVYSGKRKLLGIATMHKSNAVPVFEDNKQLAVEISQMRRG